MAKKKSHILRVRLKFQEGASKKAAEALLRAWISEQHNPEKFIGDDGAFLLEAKILP